MILGILNYDKWHTVTEQDIDEIGLCSFAQLFNASRMEYNEH